MAEIGRNPDEADYSIIWGYEAPQEFRDILEEVKLSVHAGDWDVEDAMEVLDVIAHDLALSRSLHSEDEPAYVQIHEQFGILRNSIFENMSKVDKQAKLDQIRADILNQNICPDLAKQAKQLVFGDGNPDADIVFIGEAPGKNEDEQGIPFVGAAGKFLNEMLALIDLEREDIYITNIVKYRPPNNRDPESDEKAAFLPYLAEQIKVIEPKLIVTLGRHSMEVLLPPGLKISQIHGEPKRYNEQVYLPLFHPAAALYNGGMRQTLIDDFTRIPSILKKIK